HRVYLILPLVDGGISNMKNFRTILLLCAGLLIILTGCDINSSSTDSSAITGSGTIAVHDIGIASEIGGKVIEVFVDEGSDVKAGDPLFQIDDTILQSQYAQAMSAVEAAKATVAAAEAQVHSAQIQYELAIQGARMQDAQIRATEWTNKSPTEIDLPVWYYEKDEKIAAYQTEVFNAEDELNAQLTNLEKELHDVNNGDFLDIEKQLAEAQAAFEIANRTLQQAKTAADKTSLESTAQEMLDSAKAELESIQLEYNRLLNSTSAQNILDARAQVAIAQKQLDNARDILSTLQTGEDSLQVKAAQAAVNQAKTAVEQAKANQAQAESALRTLNIQLEKTTVKAPIDGVVLSSSLSVGELAMPGGVVMTIGQLDDLEVTVYISEVEYGKIKLNQEVQITADSFPNQTFTGEVKYISDEAEFTPKNVQTVDGRKSTVYAIKISVPNENHDLKPGIPVDVEF
ncbi:MAG: efflux RND transporter periplasmic adaptor subunit, partial [Anaerolineales bacterium]|nr:efflux RND transporter periplasmic adaptor subunit [Anaerolineales bacterium]